MNTSRPPANRAVTWTAALGCAAALLSPPALGGPQTIYRCGQTYQQWPCKDGKALAVDDSRDPAQQQAAHETAAAERRTADGLAAERREREKGLLPATQEKTARASAPAAAPPVHQKTVTESAGKRKPHAPAPEPQRYYPRNPKPEPTDGRIAKP